MKQKNFLVMIALLFMSTNVLAAKPILNIIDEPVPVNVDGTPRSLEEVRAAIVAGCLGKGWSPVLDGDMQVQCSILVRGRHYAEIKIPYTQSKYSILYSDSRDLDYDPERHRIHRNYNKWVILLSKRIQQQFSN